MINPLREDLLGYLVGALEPHEQKAVEDALAADGRLRRELDLLQRGLLPLAAVRESYEPPVGLAERTCAFVAERRRWMPAALSPPSRYDRGAYPGSGWAWYDLAAAAAVFMVASMLMFPALNRGRIAAQFAVCQDHLRQIGLALTAYSEDHGRFFPIVPVKGPLAAGGYYGPALVAEERLDERLLVCPGDAKLAEDRNYHVPSAVEVSAAQGDHLRELQARMAGSYGYTLGHMLDGRYEGTRNQRRQHFAVLSDLPNATCTRSSNHGGCGHNVWFEDGHIEALTSCNSPATLDNLFLNLRGEVAPGLNPDDAVITARPVLVSLEQ